MKQAFKEGGLVVGRTSPAMQDDGYYISGSYWTAWIRADHVPKEIKAAVIELTGELPEKGEVYRATKGGNQYEIEQRDIYDLPSRYEEANVSYHITQLMIRQADKVCRFLQEVETNTITGLNETFISLIDPGEIDKENGEIGPEGPRSAKVGGPCMIWGNNIGYFGAYIRQPGDDPLQQEEKLWKHLKEIDVI